MKRIILLSILFLPLTLSPLKGIAADLPTLAIVDFTSAVRRTNMVQMFPDILSEKLVNEVLFDVLEREKLNSAVTELGLSGSGLVSQDAAIEVGKVIGAQYMLTGKILDFSKTKKTFRNYGTQIATMTAICPNATSATTRSRHPADEAGEIASQTTGVHPTPHTGVAPAISGIGR